MGYIENNLSNDEKIIARIEHSWAGILPEILRFIVFIALSVAFFCLDKIVGSIMGAVGSSTNALKSSEIQIYSAMGYALGALMLLLGLLVFIAQIAEIKCAQLVVTNKRIFGRRGFISKRTTDILISKVDTINVNNNFFGALLKYGTIEIVSGASGGMTRAERAALKYMYISNTTEFRKAVLDTIEKNKKDELEAQAKLLSSSINKSE